MIILSNLEDCLCCWEYKPNGGKIYYCEEHIKSNGYFKLILIRQLKAKAMKEYNTNLNYMPREK